jgi:hypothetical protein
MQGKGFEPRTSRTNDMSYRKGLVLNGEGCYKTVEGWIYIPGG